MPDFRRVKQAKAVFSQNIKAGTSVEAAIVNTAHHFGIRVEAVWECYQDGRFDEDMNSEHATEARVLKVLTDKGGECTRTQLLNQIQSAADISPDVFVSALAALEKQRKIRQREEHGTVYVRQVKDEETATVSSACEQATIASI